MRYENMKKLLLLLCVLVTVVFLVSCTPATPPELEEQLEDLGQIVEEGIQEATADDSILDEAAAANALATQTGDCVIPTYPGSVEQTLNAAPMIEQGAFTTSDDVALVQAWFDINMQTTWFEEQDWNRGSKRWVTGDFDVQSQAGCSAMIDIERNQEGSTTIGTVLMDFS
jgi:hypothetical protein